MSVSYKKRMSLFQKGEHAWRVEDSALVSIKPDGTEKRYSWAEASHMRAAFWPTQWAPWRHVFVITFKRGKPVVIDNAHFKSFGEWEDRSGQYILFVKAAIDKIAAAAPEAHGHIGAAPLSYYLQIGLVIASFAGLAVTAMLIPIRITPLRWVQIGIIVSLIPLVYRWAIRSRPRGVKLDPAAFADGLPKVE